MVFNLRALSNSQTSVINPNTSATRRRSTGSQTDPSGRRVPVYSDVPVRLQVQAMDGDDIQKIEGLNIQGIRRKVYTNGVISGLIRVGQKGGDMIIFAPGTPNAPPEGNTWLCVHVLEQWGPWCAVVITLQDGP